LLHLERRHGAHFQVAALQRRHFGALFEQGGGGIDIDLDRRIGGFDLGLEAIHRLRQEVADRCGGGNPQARLRLGQSGAGQCGASQAGEKRPSVHGKSFAASVYNMI
jgi:hypothetical protein